MSRTGFSPTALLSDSEEKSPKAKDLLHALPVVVPPAFDSSFVVRSWKQFQSYFNRSKDRISPERVQHQHSTVIAALGLALQYWHENSDYEGTECINPIYLDYSRSSKPRQTYQVFQTDGGWAGFRRPSVRARWPRSSGEQTARSSIATSSRCADFLPATVNVGRSKKSLRTRKYVK